MTSEEIIYFRLLDELESSIKFEVLSAHPPSGKSYSYDLIRIPSPDQNFSGSERDHIDLIFCSNSELYLCELKGSSSESERDIEKLSKISTHYSLDELKLLINKRLSIPTDNLNSVKKLRLCIGAEKLESKLIDQFTYFSIEDNHVKVYRSINGKAEVLSNFFR